jgi:hypothetical protein
MIGAQDYGSVELNHAGMTGVIIRWYRDRLLGCCDEKITPKCGDGIVSGHDEFGDQQRRIRKLSKEQIEMK